MILILLGPPGAGKGTQADAIAADYGIPKLSTGDMLRAAAASGSELGRHVQAVMSAGKLVEDDIMVSLIRHRIRQADCARGFILDGFPRTLAQAEALTRMLAGEKLSLSAVLELEVEDKALIARICGRFACAGCGAGYHDHFKPTRVAGICDECGSKEFTRRKDDTAETVAKRLEAYHAMTSPLLPYYENMGLLRSVDGMQEIEAVRREIQNLLKRVAAA